MRFDWDRKKVESNLAKHRITFEEAVTIFDDPLGLAVGDEKKTEPRHRRIGRSDRTSVIVVVFTTRDDAKRFG